jgi:hypothetical protein
MLIIVLLLNAFILSQCKNVCNIDEMPNIRCRKFVVEYGRNNCERMSKYCAYLLNNTVNNIFFTSACDYEENKGWIGKPRVGRKYTCCVF